MDDFNDFDFEEYDETEEGEVEEAPEGESSNRTFIIIAAVIGAVLVLGIICIAVYGLWYLPRQNEQRANAVATADAKNTMVAQAAAFTAEAIAWTDTPTVTPTQLPATPTASPAPTDVVVPTDTPAGDLGPTPDRTLTLQALFTGQPGDVTVTPLATDLPKTGFADDVGIPGMLALAATLIVVIFLARRLRTAR